ncbi:PEP-CTERM sorting domain-containing protein [Aquincola tertiaricarbonis]|uniref:PEP-CTERM sorting domain-containing protein n=1 Tax=Aquincola tertiaricarbonis TaxID=391953 RepID=A0ABY4S3I2_AQUTE|nr:PEP-CTERM sorting domain-containing protein [Aquincola tertiaricarbonis]URI06780.1 PEP-CTERM sorting domain-containing protein [Aquincola tertiaricarbonis]
MIRSFNLIARLRAVPAAALLAALTSTAPAQAAIPFFGTQFDASAVAEADGSAPEADWQMDGDTVSAQAASVGDVHAATAGAFAGPGFLTVSADVSAGTLSHAVASAHFSGSFLSTGTVSLSLDYNPLTFTEGSGAAATTLFVSLSNGGATLFEDYVQGPWSFSYTPVAGSTSVLDLTLSSEVSAAFLSPGTGNASAFGSVAIMGAVPEASTWLMFSLGLAGVAALGRRRSRAAEVQA